MTDTIHLLAIHALRTAVEATIDAQVFYQDAFRAACRPAWDAHYPVAENRLPDVLLDDDAEWSERQEVGRAAKEQAAAGPRGTWALVRNRREGGTERFNTLIHDGAGIVHARSDGWAETPTFAQVVDRMVGMEIYRVRRAVEQERADAAAATRLGELRLAVGMKLRNVMLSRERYSSAIVEAVIPSTGTVQLFLTRRGSRQRWRTNAPATAIQFTGSAASRAEPESMLCLVNRGVFFQKC